MSDSPPPTTVPASTISQDEVDDLLRLSGFLQDDDGTKRSLIDEIQEAILNSGKLTLPEWIILRNRLREVERLAPHIDLIISLRQARSSKL